MSAPCPSCGGTVVHLDPITFAVRCVPLAGRLFCSEACVSTWARAEVQRLRGWLRAIQRRSRGLASDLASLASNSTATAEDYFGKRGVR